MRIRKAKIPPFDPDEFPILVQYDSQIVENAIQKLMQEHGMSRHEAFVNLELDLQNIELLVGRE